MVQHIDTERVANTITSLQKTQSNINTSFATMNRTVTRNLNGWHGRASDAARSMFQKVCDGNEARSIVLDNYITMLQKQIVPNYVGAEDANQKLANLFD